MHNEITPFINRLLNISKTAIQNAEVTLTALYKILYDVITNKILKS